jgi:hypothetical protein
LMGMTAFGHASVPSRSNRLRPIHFMGLIAPE